MEHLLLTRFQGALIGANTIYLSQYQISPNQLIVDTTSAMINGITSLIDRDKFDPQTWALDVFTDIPDPDQAIVTMLPLMLFFHEDRVRLREILIAVSDNWQLDWETSSSATAIGYIISRSLTESFDPKTIIPQLLAEMINLHPLLFQSLSTIISSTPEHQLSAPSSSLHQITQILNTNPHPIITPTVLAIYCFLSTPEDFSLATRRAYHSEDRSQLTCALTGTFAGAQNSLTGIPLNGYIVTQQRAQWLIAAESLLTAWAGVYHQQSAANSPPLAVASPQVIQRRN